MIEAAAVVDILQIVRVVAIRIILMMTPTKETLKVFLNKRFIVYLLLSISGYFGHFTSAENLGLLEKSRTDSFFGTFHHRR